MLRALSAPMVRVVERWLPGSLVFAVVLTFIVAGMALVLTDAGPGEVLMAWGDGLTGLLAFMTQMALVLLLGYVLANTGPVRTLLVRAATLPRNPAQAYGFVALMAALASLLTWGLGLVVAALLSIEVSRVGRERGMRLHFPLLVAAGYSGFGVWHMGYSGSGPLAAATPGSFVEKMVGHTIPITQTIFSWWNLAGIVVAVAALTTGIVMLRPRSDDRIVELPEGAELDAGGASPRLSEETTPADRIDSARAVTLLIGLLLLAYLVMYFATNGFDLTLDIVNWTFLCLILLLVDSPRRLGELVADAARNVGDILVQFPFYAGILGMMSATGLIAILSDVFVAISTPATLGLWAFLAGGIVNIFVPSGGGQFAVQAPIFLDAASRLGVDPAIVVMGIAYGDQWTNMIQPFWALPLLAMARLRIRDVMGYTSVTLIVLGVVFGAIMLVAAM
ncbi:short-chain fatty acid transporter [Mobilicoccus caccae]|uniref:Short-chain fatty acids transporter n=1 Tax=Mobilicoccus caccae TaxID=1859295 RepID=A0ABQ6IRQ0_9MICO|nr:TIGR00366 family protein [Mobilicoccus caccae]GMA40129.1 short-chain fatty acids transporter [Mobilicoccus caccae]